MKHDTFSFPEVSYADSITSQFYEDGSVTFSDIFPPVTHQASQVTLPASHVTSLVTGPASQPPVHPLAQQNCNRMPRNTPKAVPRVSPTNIPALSHAGISSRSQNCTMSHTMAESISQRNFYGPTGMHYMSACATTGRSNNGQTVEDLLHDEHLTLQDPLLQPIAFHAEMMGNIMYLNQALCRKPPRYVPYKCTYVPYEGAFGASDQGQTLDV
jgi:hypothetical protein